MRKFTLDREDTILFVIDIQERLAPVMEYKDQVIHNNKILLNVAKEMNIPVVYTEQYPKGLGGTVQEMLPLLENASRFEKVCFTAYIDGVKERLAELGRKKVLITGMETHVCVFQTVRDLLSNGYEVFVLKDAVASRTKMNYLNGLELMSNMGAVITNTETVAFDLLKTSGTPEFKTISKLIK